MNPSYRASLLVGKLLSSCMLVEEVPIKLGEKQLKALESFNYEVIQGCTQSRNHKNIELSKRSNCKNNHEEDGQQKVHDETIWQRMFDNFPLCCWWSVLTRFLRSDAKTNGFRVVKFGFFCGWFER